MDSQEEQTQPREGIKKVALCGFADSWKQAPFADPTVEVWGLNELWKYVPRWDRWFELHDGETLGVTKRDLSEGEVKRHLEWLTAQPAGKPIYMQPAFCDGRFPAATAYPLERLSDKFGRYFTSTIGYMLALAIDEGYDWIGCYGIDLASDVEYAQQRPNAEYFIGLARGMGKTVEIAPSSALCKGGHLYGFEKPLGQHGGLSDIVAKHRQRCHDEREKALSTLNTLEGAIQAYDNVAKVLQYGERGASPSAM